MVSFIVRLKFASEEREEMAETLRQLAAASREEPGCVSYVPHQLEDDPDTAIQGRQGVGRTPRLRALQETGGWWLVSTHAGTSRREPDCTDLILLIVGWWFTDCRSPLCRIEAALSAKINFSSRHKTLHQILLTFGSVQGYDSLGI